MKLLGRSIFLILLAALAVTAGCGKGADDTKATQVAARVNGDEITVHQINDALQRLGNVPEGQAKQAQKQVLDRLVDQQLLVQQSIDKKLDRNPGVVSALDAARRQILAQAYVEQVMVGAQKASADQIKEFYGLHPELFANRRVYRFAQMAVAVPADRQERVHAKLEELDRQPDKQQILPQFANWLKTQNLEFRATQSTQGAEQLPLDALPKYQQLKVGDLLFEPSRQGVVVSQLVAVQSQPLTQEQAQPFIEQFLHNRERLKLSDDEMKRLHIAAKIEYVGDFARADKALAPVVNAPAATQATTASTEDAIQKGLEGMKK